MTADVGQRALDTTPTTAEVAPRTEVRKDVPAPAPPAPSSGAGWIVPLAVLIVGMFMSVLDSSIVNVAIPDIQNELSGSPDSVAWVVTGYTLALGVVVPLSGWLGMRFGQSRLYIVSVLGFAAGSALCGLAWNLDSLIAFRILQAIPGGVLPVITLTMLYQIVPVENIGAAMGLYGLGVVVAPAVGPTLGGYLVEYTDWRVIFYINVPIGILGAALALAVFPRVRPTTWPKFDLWGFLTIAYALFALLLAFSEGQSWGWTGYRVIILFASSLISLALFVIIELEVDNPIIDLRVLRCYPYTLSLVLISITTTALFTGLYFLPQFLQQVQGMQSLDAGLVLTPAAMVLLVLMPIAGRIYDKIGPRYPVMIGLAIIAGASYQLAQLTPDTTRGYIELWLTARNIGVGLAMMPIMTSGVSALSRQLTTSGSAMNNVMQRVASSVAVAVFGGLNLATTAQMTADNGSMITTGPGESAALAAAQAQGGQGLYGVYEQLAAGATTHSYDNGFYITAWLCAGAVLLAATMRSGKAKQSGESVVVEM
jgi:EmrB/QacA subfamily drug resistance transporter